MTFCACVWKKIQISDRQLRTCSRCVFSSIMMPMKSHQQSSSQHPFLAPVADSQSVITGLIERVREARRQRTGKDPLGQENGEPGEEEEEEEDENDSSADTVRRVTPTVQTGDTGSSAELVTSSGSTLTTDSVRKMCFPFSRWRSLIFFFFDERRSDERG